MLGPYKDAVLYSEIVAAIIGTLFIYKYKKTSLKYFLYLLWYIVFTEILGKYADELNLSYIGENGVKYNFWLYNLLYSIILPVLYLIYFNLIKTAKFKFWIKIFVYLFLIISIINWSFIQNFRTEWLDTPFIVGAIFLTIIILLYFIELLRSEKIVTFHKSLLFWISVGLLIFYTSTIPFRVVQNIYATSPDISIVKLFIIKYILAIAMYVIFSFGFIWSKKE